ncbi:nicotinate-nucleotide--dimethylbenzimidazole phosphoribosyltransferase [Streptomyces sp. NPDC047017]|uniref:nicotinate-nucleotide--dimethylbenzimidazole phosphoribosyltransferase n=1 Tax=Streptomyces sp. NPDC047017 TaxID=3155024 RepID=UPI0033EDE06F
MTDTGQVPGEGLPESAGMVEQPGVPAHGVYTYLSESPAEDEDLLLPGAQGAWGNEVPPPAPEPVVEAVHEPGPHEISGRDSGSVDLGAVLHPDPTAAAPAAPPRRPLHLGPVIPDASASPVRSLADRGPADAPVRQPGPPAAGPEHSDTAQAAARRSAPQGGAPWGAQAAATAPVPSQAEPWGTAAETVVPEAEPVGPAQATMARLAAQATAPAPAPQDIADAQAPEGAEHAHAEVPTTGDTAPEGEATQAAEGLIEAPEAAQAPAETQAPEAARAPEPVHAAEPAHAAETVHAAESVEPPAPAEAPADARAVTEAVAQAPEPAQVPAAAQAPEAAEAPVPDGVTETAQAPAVDDPAQPAGAPAPEETAEVQQTAGTEQATEDTSAPEAAQPQPLAAPEAVPAPAAVDAPAPVDAQEVVPAPAAAAAQPAVPVEAAPESGEAPTAEQPQPVAPEVPVAADPAIPASADATGTDALPATETPAAPEPAAPAAPAAPEEQDQAAPAPAAEAAPLDGPAAPADPQPVTPVIEPEAAPVAPEAPVVVPEAPDAAVAADAAAEEAEAQAPAPAEPAPADPAPAEAALPATPEPPKAPAPAPAAPEAPQTPDTVLPDTAALPEAATPENAPPADAPLGQFVPVEGSVPTTPHLAPTPPHPLVVPAEQAPQAPVATVPAPRDGAAAPVAATGEPDPEVAQRADDLATRDADQEEQQDRPVEQHADQRTDQHQEESPAAVAQAPRPTGPAAPGYDEAEREAVLKVMRERRDIRNGFRGDPIPHEVLLRVLEAAHTAPSVGHSQPWDFVVIRSAETRRAMHELAMRQRDAYAKSLPKGRAKQFKELKIEAILDTPVNIVVTADPTRGGRHTLGRHTQPQMAPYSAALAVENLWLAARAEGLGVGWVSFFDEREMVRALGLPEHLEVIAYLCVGYVDEFPDEPELMQAGWSKRRPLSWVVHEETYGRRALPGEDPHDLLAETVAGIRPLDAKALGEAWERQKRMTKPAGALGMLEIISAQLAGLSRQCPPPIPEPAAVAIFAGDHGVHAQGVTPWPQEVTAQMVANFLGGGAVCNAFAAQVGAEVCVVDVGVAADLPATPGLLPRKIRGGTSDMTTGPAMTREEAKKAIEVGIETARDLVAAGNKALLTGEMGIANTTASAALISVFTGADPAEVTGRGTGINDETLARKTEVVRRALDVHQPDPADPIGVLAAVGGFEHAAMVGLLLGGASLRTPVILDGVSAGAAALVARAIAPEVLAACIAGHRSAEPGHVAALNKLGLRPLVDLDLRLGEGTGALLALPLVQSTARAMHEVATFDSAGVTEK